MNDIEFFQMKMDLIKEGYDLVRNVTWCSYVETQLKVIQWKIKVHKFLMEQ